ncbi:FadR/GntR family transcriptional regulator [Rossellomorea aquimaris]|jgi:GntR family transcriptional regulator, transcriptional repressor for pyruvate dehydrogenase complex|uniref:FadR/GntR family transcriptional regulator n=1 Tax=Bacillaceae TaxID=186817 RepID=UPI0011EC4E72|nr:FadR/GntR family transcriptional regulator [Bacillus sp. CH30_1T]KAA0566692.1 FadR family transcriptional regulator [Bacillus sp. CH30_1T]
MKAIKKKRLSEIGADEIKKYIEDEGLKYGDRLPSVAELVDLLQIGRSSLREALQLLESQGVIEILNGKGTFIRESKPFQIQMAFEVEDKKNFLLETLEVREALEKKAVELAVKAANDEDVEEMTYHLQQYVQFLQTGQRQLANQADARFHQAIYAASKNMMLESIIDSVWDTFHEFWNEPFGIDDIFDQSYPYHEKLLQGIRERNSKSALEAFDEIIQSVKQSIYNIN